MVSRFLILACAVAAAGCGDEPKGTDVLPQYRDRIDARLKTVEAIHSQAQKLPRVTEDELEGLDPPPDFSRQVGPGKAVFVELDHLLKTERRNLGLDFIVSYDTTVTTVATVVRDGHYPPPNEHVKLDTVEGWILEEDLEPFLQLRYLFLIRPVEVKKPFLMGTQEQALETRRYLPGFWAGEVLAFDLETGRHVGGYHVRVETDPQVTVKTNYYLTDLWRSLAKKAMERIEARLKELCPAARLG